MGARAGPQIPPRGGLLIGNFQGWIGVYRVQHSFLVVCPKKEKAQSRDVRVKSWLERSISHLEGGGQTRWVFYTNEKSTAANYTTHRMLIWDTIQPRQTSKGLLGHRRGSIHRRAAHPEPQDSRRTRGRGGQKPIPNERKELELPPTVSQDLRESEEEEEPAGRRARVQGYIFTTPISFSSLGGLGQTEDGVECEYDDGGRVYPTRSSS